MPWIRPFFPLNCDKPNCWATCNHKSSIHQVWDAFCGFLWVVESQKIWSIRIFPSSWLQGYKCGLIPRPERPIVWSSVVHRKIHGILCHGNTGGFSETFLWTNPIWDMVHGQEMWRLRRVRFLIFPEKLDQSNGVLNTPKSSPKRCARRDEPKHRYSAVFMALHMSRRGNRPVMTRWADHISVIFVMGIHL